MSREYRREPRDVSNDELRQLISFEKAGAITAYARVCLAARRGTGARLTADEVSALVRDNAVTTAVEAAVLERRGT